MTTLRESTRLDPDPRGSAELSFEVTDTTRCLRIIAITARAGLLSATLLDDSGPRASVTASPRFAILPASGPVCVDKPGVYRVKLQGDRGVPLTVAIWQAE
jgi:hypothetical protein